LTGNAAKKQFGSRALSRVAAEAHRAIPVGLNRSRVTAGVGKRGGKEGERKGEMRGQEVVDRVVTS